MPSTCSHELIIMSVGCLPSGRLSISGLRPMRIRRLGIFRMYVAWQVSLPMNQSVSPRISPSAGWWLVGRWPFKNVVWKGWMTSPCLEAGGCFNSPLPFVISTKRWSSERRAELALAIPSRDRVRRSQGSAWRDLSTTLEMTEKGIRSRWHLGKT